MPPTTEEENSYGSRRHIDASQINRWATSWMDYITISASPGNDRDWRMGAWCCPGARTVDTGCFNRHSIQLSIGHSACYHHFDTFSDPTFHWPGQPVGHVC